MSKAFVTIASFQNTVQASRDENELELNRALAEKYTQKFIDGELCAEASMLKLASGKCKDESLISASSFSGLRIYERVSHFESLC